MDIKIIELRKLTASTGYILTDGEVYGTEVYLGCNDRAENWQEVSIAVYEEVLRKEEAELNVLSK